MEVPDQNIFDNGNVITGTLTAEVSLWWDGGEYIIADDYNGPDASYPCNAPDAGSSCAGFPYDADQSPNGQYEFTGTLGASAVPEPATYIAGPFLLLLIGASALRTPRKKQVA